MLCESSGRTTKPIHVLFARPCSVRLSQIEHKVRVDPIKIYSESPGAVTANPDIVDIAQRVTPCTPHKDRGIQSAALERSRRPRNRVISGGVSLCCESGARID